MTEINMKIVLRVRSSMQKTVESVVNGGDYLIVGIISVRMQQ